MKRIAEEKASGHYSSREKMSRKSEPKRSLRAKPPIRVFCSLLEKVCGHALGACVWCVFAFVVPEGLVTVLRSRVARLVLMNPGL